VHPRRKLYVALHKPPGFLCTRHDPEGRRTVGSLLPKEWKHLFTVGRLDVDSQGLLLLTNDGEFSHRITHPRHGASKTYRVQLLGRVGPEIVDDLIRGVRDRGECLRAVSARWITASKSRSEFELVLTEGKNLEIRRIFAVLGHTVARLERVKIGRIQLGELPEGKWRTLTESEIKSLLATL
jgi:23S rRNA pseudouridine2605 synthase